MSNEWVECRIRRAVVPYVVLDCYGDYFFIEHWQVSRLLKASKVQIRTGRKEGEIELVEHHHFDGLNYGTLIGKTTYQLLPYDDSLSIQENVENLHELKLAGHKMKTVDEILEAVSKLNYADTRMLKDKLGEIKDKWLPKNVDHLITSAGALEPTTHAPCFSVERNIRFGMVYPKSAPNDSTVLLNDYRRYHLCYLAWREVVGWDIRTINNRNTWAIEESNLEPFELNDVMGGSPLLGFWFDSKHDVEKWWDMISWLFEGDDNGN